MELLYNAMSLLPAVPAALAHAAPSNAFHDRMSALSYLILCVFSAHFHLVCWLRTSSLEQKRRALVLDMLAQDACIFYTCAAAGRPWLALMTLLASLANPWTATRGSPRAMLLRNIRCFVAVLNMAAGCSNRAFMCALLGGGLYMVGVSIQDAERMHTGFHLLLSAVLCQVWGSRGPSSSSGLEPLALHTAAFMFLVLAFRAVRCWNRHRAALHGLRALLSAACALLAVLGAGRDEWALFHMRMEMAAHAGVLLGSGEDPAHNLLMILFAVGAEKCGMHHRASVVMALMHASDVLGRVARCMFRMEWEREAIPVAYAHFVIFLLSRILVLPGLLAWSMFHAGETLMPLEWLGFHCLLGAVWLSQLMWFSSFVANVTASVANWVLRMG